MCGCSKNRSSSSLTASAGGTSYTYKVTLPSGEEKTFLTPLEGKTAIRKAGGGSIHRVAV